MYTEEQIFNRVREILCERFELVAEQVQHEATLVEDLDLDSIDLFDLLTLFEKETGKTLGVHDFRSVRTVGDLVGSLHIGLQKGHG